MPRAEATGDAGGAAGGKARSTEAQTNTRGSNISLDPSSRVKIPVKGSLDVDSKLFSKVQIDSKKDWVIKSSKIPGTSQSRSQSEPTILRSA